MKTKIFLSILFVAFGCAKAFADALYVGAWSYHIGPTPAIDNAMHNLVAVEYKTYTVGYFKNSFNEETGFIAKRFQLFSTSNFKGAIYVGIDYGYNGCDKKRLAPKNTFCALAVPEIAFTKYKTQIVVSLLNKAIAIGPKWEF